MYLRMYVYLCVDYISPESLKSFLHESLLMKSFDHPNVLDVIGVGFDTESGNEFPFMVLPFMVNGDLKTFLKRKRQNPTVVDHLPKVCYLCCLFTVLLYTAKIISHSYFLLI